MKENNENYYLGLDIGTNSIGWAVTDLFYQVYKFNRKAMWGIRLFEEGKTAQERRLHRSARRLTQRRVKRIKLLQEFFSEAIVQSDDTFFLRLNESKYKLEDKEERIEGIRFNLFNDPNYTDVDFHNEYPTIYHLRHELITNPKKHDIRLYYLAIEHILKHRGHFLFEGKEFNYCQEISDIFLNTIASFNDKFGTTIHDTQLDEVKAIMKDPKKRMTDKKTEMVQLLAPGTKNRQEKAFCHVLVGSKVNLSELFDNPDFIDETDKPIKIQFSDLKYDELRPALEELLEDDGVLIDQLKLIYDWGILTTLLNDKDYLSEAKIESYNKHQRDLKKLKKVVKKYLSKEDYKEIFMEKGNNNYCAYIGKVVEKKIEKTIKKCSQSDFCAFIKKKLESIHAQDETRQYILTEIELGTLMPKQKGVENSVIPYQIHLKELQKILEHASKHYPFFSEKDAQGISVSEKIEKIFTFRIPYYIGPLNDSHKGVKNPNCWIVKRPQKANQKIRPWNYEEIVDVEKTAEVFIERMTNKCTYLVGEDVLPKHSLLYSEFTVLNELNNLRINGERLSTELKCAIFQKLFMQHKRVTRKHLTDYLKIEGLSGEITGIDGDFKSSMSSYIDIQQIIGEKIKNEKMVEDLIKWSLLFGEDKKLLKSKIKQSYSKALTENEIKRFSGLTFKGWGRLSRAFLTTIYHQDETTGERLSIIKMLRLKSENLMELLSSDYDYLEEIERFNQALLPDSIQLDYQIVEDMTLSPATKRSIWQALLIVSEVSKIMKGNPKRIFVEVARGKEGNKRSRSRKENLKELYKKLKGESSDWIAELESRRDADFRRDRLYLYYTQMGRCLYTNQPIKIENLYNPDLYDVDHIYPQSKIKDDSLDNRVLVLRQSNVNKTDRYPIERAVQEKQQPFWKMLLVNGFISRTKYHRLTRTEPFKENELSAFIERQLVETRQSTKAVIGLLKQHYPSADIVYVKAGNVSDFRQHFDLLKNRDLNDFHHARDAYLNIVVGNVFHTKFTSNPRHFIQSRVPYNLSKMYESDVRRRDTIAWDKDMTIGIVKHQMRKNNILFTRYAYTGKGELFDLQPVKAGKAQAPLKASDIRLQDTSKYGGYNKIKGAYFFYVEHEKSKKMIRSIEFIPVLLSASIQSDQDLMQYSETVLSLNKPKILINKIKLDTLFEVDGMRLHISGRSEDRLLFKNAMQLILNQDLAAYIRTIHVILKKAREKQIDVNRPLEKVTREKNLLLYNCFIDKLENKPYNLFLSSQAMTLREKRDQFESLEEYEQCEVLAQINQYFQCNRVCANLKTIGGPGAAGTIIFSKNLFYNHKGNHEYFIVNQSITGLFEQKVNLKTL